MYTFLNSLFLSKICLFYIIIGRKSRKISPFLLILTKSHQEPLYKERYTFFITEQGI